MARWRESEIVYEAASQFRDRCLSEGTSFLWPDRRAWSSENLSALWEAFVNSPDEGKRTFFEKWRDQLSELDEDVHRVAVDMLAFYYLFPTNIGFETKMSNLRKVIGWKLSNDPPNFDLIEDAFIASVGAGGMLYNTKMPWQMTFYLQFFSEMILEGLDPSDVDVCKRLANRVRSEVKSSNPAHNILLHLFFPERFERTAADSHKQHIVEAFRDISKEAQDVDEALENIRRSLSSDYGEDFDFYDEDMRPLWNSSPKEESEILTAEQYTVAFQAIEKTSDSNLKMLQVQYHRPERAVSARQLAQAMGFQNYNAANLRYGTLGRLVGEQLGLDPNRGWKILSTGRHSAGSEFNWIMRPEVAEALEELNWIACWTGDPPPPPAKQSNLNTILFGPPGTGKTYSVQRRAAGILEALPEGISEEEISEKFRDYREEGRIEFVTFHPSFSYEEFVEGFRYDVNEKIPALHDGIFKDICKRAINPRQEQASLEGAKIWKISLGTKDQQHIFERCMENDEISIGWLENENLSDLGENEPKLFEEDLKLLFENHHPGGSPQSVVNFVNRMSIGDYVAVRGSEKTIRAIGTIIGGYEYRENYGEQPHVRRVEWLDLSEQDISRINGNKPLVQQTVYELKAVSLQDFVTLLPAEEKHEDKPYVLIVDEINRGNISRIFGELITLLEPDKRLGAENELSVKLPYSGEDFSVPKNLHVIGTMNTADRSIALLDIALRRRFEFEEMLPDVALIQNILTEKDSEVDVELICNVFEVLNARISALLDRDHQLGHTYFLPATSLKKLHHIFYKRIFPLLQEYFYNDAVNLTKLLGKYEEGESRGFIEKPAAIRNLGSDFDTDHLWEFHPYEPDELEAALKRTLTRG